MSKASEWAKRPKFPRLDLIWKGIDACPNAQPILFSDGVKCGIGRSVLLSSDDALDLARWILDTFGEPPPAPIAEREAGK